MPINLGRETFQLLPAPRWQYCSCGCRQPIAKGQLVHTRKLQGQRVQGSNRILDLEDHYRAWLDNEARKYAAQQAANDRAFAEYLGGRR